MRSLKNTIILLVILLSHFQLISRQPVSPYFFYGPDFESLIPFDKQEMLIIKQNNVKVIEKYSEEKNYKWICEYHFDKGLLVKEKCFEVTGKRKKSTDSTFYKYDEKGRLLVRKSFGHVITYDSLGYNTNNQVSYYLSYERQPCGKKKYLPISIIHSLKLDTIVEEFLKYSDSADSLYKSYYLFDKEGKIVSKGIDGKCTDTIIRNENNDVLIENYYTYYRSDSVPQLGLKRTYKKDILIEQIRYNLVCIDLCINDKENYCYDTNGALILISNSNKYAWQRIYLRDSEGLISVEIDDCFTRTRVTRYNVLY